MTIRLWELSTGAETCQFPGYQSIPFVAFSPGGQTLASGSADHRVCLWNLTTEQLTGQLIGHQGGVRCVAYFPDGHILASGSHDHTIRLWDLNAAEDFFQFNGHSGWVSSLAFSRDGQMLASGSEDKTLRVWDVATGKLIYQVQRHLQRVEGVAFSPDGKALASCSWDRTIRLWEPATGRPLRKTMGHCGGVKTIAFSPDSKLLASGGGDAAIRVWDVDTGKLVRNLAGHQGVVFSVAFSPDGKLLASGGDSTVRVWDLASGKELLLFQGHQGLVLCVAFAPDGKTVASASTGGSLEIRPGVEQKPKSSCTINLAALDLESLWTDLAEEDVRKALRASRTLAAIPQRALPFLKSKLRPVPPVNEAQLTRWLAELAHTDSALRAEAARELVQLGEPAASRLQRALADAPAPEIKIAVQQLLEQIKHTAPSRETMRDVRAAEVLRKIGGFQAEQVLAILARGAAGASLTLAAEAALNRLRHSTAERTREELALQR